MKTPTNIRFDIKTKKRLLSVAEQFGITQSELVRRATEEKLSDWERRGVLIITSKQQKVLAG